MLAARRRSSSSVRGRAPAILTREGGRGWREGGRKEVKGEVRHNRAMLQHRHSLRWWCGIGKGFTLIHRQTAYKSFNIEAESLWFSSFFKPFLKYTLTKHSTAHTQNTKPSFQQLKMWPLLFSTQPICQKCSIDFIGTLNPCAICMSCLSHQDVITQRTEEKEDLEAGVQGKEPFSACNREQLWKKKILMTRTKEKSRARGWHLRIGSGCIFADVHGGGYCYCCGQILLSPVHAWWMNHLAIGQANSHCRCNKQKSSLPHCSLHITQTIRVEEKKGRGTESPPSYPSAYSCKKIISKCLVHV